MLTPNFFIINNGEFHVHRLLNVLVTGWLISSTPWLVYDQRCKPICARPGFDRLLKAKMDATMLHVLLETACMFCRLWTCGPTIMSVVSMEVFDLASAACLIVLFNIYHQHEPRPSTVLSIYLALDIVAKAVFLWQQDATPSWTDWRILSLLLLLLKVRLIQLQERPKWPRQSTRQARSGRGNGVDGFWTARLGLSILPLLYHVHDRRINKNDIIDIPYELYNRRLNRKFDALWSKYASKKHALVRVIVAACKPQLIQAIVVTFLKSLVKFTIPFLVESLVKSLELHQSSQNQALIFDVEAIHFSLKILALFISHAVLESCSAWINNNAALKLRGMLLSATARKVLVLEDHHLAEYMQPSLITKDIKTIQNSIAEFQITASSCIDSTISIYLFWHYLGRNILGTVLTIFAFTIICTYIGSVIASTQAERATVSAIRVMESARLLRSARAAKMANKMSSLLASITSLHDTELDSRAKCIYRSGLHYLLLVALHSTMPLFIIKGAETSLLEGGAAVVKCLALSSGFTDDVRYILKLSERWIAPILAFSRMEKALQLPNATGVSIKSPAILYNPAPTPGPSVMIEIQSAYISATLDSPFILRDVNISFLQGSLSIVTGDVASGKTTFLRGIAGRAPIEAGYLTLVTKNIGFCGQDPWIENKSIRENIVGPATFHRPWFNVVIQACALHAETAAFGERFIVGHNGNRLNRAQQQRVALARAVYSRAPILLLDNILGSQSPPIAATLIQRLFSRTGLLRSGTTVVLTTLQPELFYGLCDTMLSIDADGTVESIDIDQQTALPQDPMLLDSDDVEQMDEVAVSPGTARIQEISDGIAKASRIRPLLQYSEDQGPILTYFQHTNLTTIILWILALIFTIILEAIPAMIMRGWTGSTSLDSVPWTYYLALSLMSGPMFAVSYIIFHNGIAAYSGKVFHQRLLQITLGATISALTHERIEHAINLFTEGSGALIGDLATVVFRLIYSASTVVFLLGLTTTVSFRTLALWPITLYLIVRICLLYVPAFVRLRQMELSTSEAVYMDFDENVTGLAHVVLSRSETIRLAQSDSIIQDSQRVKYHCELLELWLKTSVYMAFAFITALFVLIAMSTNARPWTISVGVSSLMMAALLVKVSIQSLGTAQYFMDAVHQIERFIKYTPQDEVRMLLPTAHEWSPNPVIELTDVSMGYTNRVANPTLQIPNLQIAGASEIGFVGALGSGKTTLALSLLSLISYTGSITVDGIEVRDIPRHQFPSLFTVIPQEPIVFRTASIRQNLIPHEIIHPGNHEGHESVMYRVLYGVGLLKVVEKNGGLRSQFSKLKLSYEQLARFSIAQGLMVYYFMRTPFALVDGATNNVSGQSLVRMKAVMREVFGPGGCAIISMVHYQETVAGATWIGRVAQGTVTQQLPAPAGMAEMQ